MVKEMGGPIGRHFGKVDLDRVGFFDDPPPGPFGKYVKPSELRDGVAKGRQMLCGQPGDLFEKEFKRIFRGEALPKPSRDEAKAKVGTQIGALSQIGAFTLLQLRNLCAESYTFDFVQRFCYPFRIEAIFSYSLNFYPCGYLFENEKTGRHIIPPSTTKKHSTPGDWYGCFGKQPSHFSPELRKSKAKNKEPANFKIKPSPLGGPGYLEICLNPYPKHANDPYDPVRVNGKKAPKLGKFISTSAPMDFFPPNPYHAIKIGPTYIRPQEKSNKVIGTGRIYVPFPKDPGGMHAGCFSEYPKYMSEPYQPNMKKGQREPRWIGGGPDLRSKYTSSIINQVTKMSCNATNYMEYHERVYPLHY